MEGDGEPCLAESVDFAGFAYDLAARRNEEVLAVVGVNVVREQAGDWAGKTAVKPVDEKRFKNCAFKQNVFLAFVSGGNGRLLSPSIRCRFGRFRLILA